MLCLIPNLNGGGAERVMINLLSGLSTDRFEVTLGLAKAEGPFLPLIPARVPVIEFGVARSLLAIPRLTRLFRSHRFDLCFSMVAMNLAAVAARSLSRARIPLVLGARNHYSLAFPAEARHARAKMMAVRLLYPRAEMVIGVAEGVCADLVTNFGVPRARTRAIHNPVDIEQVRALAAERVDHPWLSENSSIPTLINVGKLQEAKGQRDLLAAVRQLKSKVNLRLLILGRGPLEPKLAQLVRDWGLEDRVQLLGFRDNPYAYIAKASAFVLSSHWEGFPNVLTEAMACGVAVISTDCPSGPSEIIEDGKSGLLVPVGDPEGLASAILRLSTDRHLRQTLARGASVRVEQFRAARIVAQYSAAFEEVTSQF